MSPILSIIIVTYRSEAEIAGCLSSIPNDLLGRPVEVIVVENHSGDRIGSMIEKCFPQVRFIDAGSNLGFSRANNLGFDQSAGDYILFLNPDTIVNRPALKACLETLHTDSSIGIISPKLCTADGKLDLACRRSIPTVWDGLTRATGLAARFPHSRICGGYNLTYLDDDGLHEVGAVNGAFMMMPRRVLSRVGLFDEQFFMYGEDLDLCFRCSRAGFRVVYDGRYSVVHLKGQSSGRDYAAMSKMLFESSARFYLKQFNPRDSRLKKAFYLSLFGLWKHFATLMAKLKGHKRVRPL